MQRTQKAESGGRRPGCRPIYSRCKKHLVTSEVAVRKRPLDTSADFAEFSLGAAYEERDERSMFGLNRFSKDAFSPAVLMMNHGSEALRHARARTRRSNPARRPGLANHRPAARDQWFRRYFWRLAGLPNGPGRYRNGQQGCRWPCSHCRY